MVAATSPVVRWVRRNRRGVAATCAALAVLMLGLALLPAPVPTAAVVVAADDLPAGHRLAGADVRVAQVAAELRPAGTTGDPGTLVGRVLAAPVSGGEPVSELRLVAPSGGGWVPPAGTAAIPVRFADAEAAALLSPGMRLDLLLGRAPSDDLMGEAMARVVAEGVLVLGLAEADAQDGLLQAPSLGTGPLVILAATRAQALAIAGAQAGGSLTFALVDAGR